MYSIFPDKPKNVTHAAKQNDRRIIIRASQTRRLLDGQYSAYSSHVQPACEQHSAVIEPGPDPPPASPRLRLRRTRSICCASSGSSVHLIGSFQYSSEVRLSQTLNDLKTKHAHVFFSPPHVNLLPKAYFSREPPRRCCRCRHRCVVPCGRCHCHRPSTSGGAAFRGIACGSRDATPHANPRVIYDANGCGNVCIL